MTVACAERTFSKLKIIKTYLRSSMSQTRLGDLSVRSMEKDRAKNINISRIVHHFATVNSEEKVQHLINMEY